MRRGFSVKPRLGHWQTVKTQIRCHRMQLLIKLCTVGLNYRKLRVKWNSLTPAFRIIFPTYTQRPPVLSVLWLLVCNMSDVHCSLFTFPLNVIDTIHSVTLGLSGWTSSLLSFKTTNPLLKLILPLYWLLTLVLLNPDIPCLYKQCRSRSVGFWRNQLIWICTVCH